MIMKPKNTVLQPRALWYKRFIDMSKSLAMKKFYKTTDGLYWTCVVEDNGDLLWSETTAVVDFISVANNDIVRYVYLNTETYYKYNISTQKWEVATLAQENVLSAKFPSTSNIQTNKYYFIKKF